MELNVRWLGVAMDSDSIVCVLERLGKLADYILCFFDSNAPSREAVRERGAWNKLHDERPFRDAVDGSNTGVVERCKDLRFALESSQSSRVVLKLRWQSFDCYLAAKFSVPCTIDLAHAA